VNKNLEIQPTEEMIQKLVLVDSFAPMIPYDEDKERDMKLNKLLGSMKMKEGGGGVYCWTLLLLGCVRTNKRTEIQTRLWIWLLYL
jgi:hypothetical protein